MFVGMNKGNVQMMWQSNSQMATRKEEIKTAKATAAGAAAAQNGTGLDVSSPLPSPVTTESSSSSSSFSSLSPVRIPQLFSHTFTITFDNIQNTKTVYASLSNMRLFPILPSPRVITGMFYGLSFDTPHEKKQAHFQQEAWFEGGAPSFTYTPIEQTDTVIQGFTQFRDECY